MKTRKSITLAVMTALLMLVAGGNALADDADVCVWSHELQRWICVPP